MAARNNVRRVLSLWIVFTGTTIVILAAALLIHNLMWYAIVLMADLIGCLVAGLLVNRHYWKKQPHKAGYETIATVESLLAQSKTALLSDNSITARKHLMDAISALSTLNNSLE